MKFNFILFTILAVILIFVLLWMTTIMGDRTTIESEKLVVEQERLSIEEEQHVDSLYTIYQQNIATCKKQAVEQKKDEAYIQENCVDPVNESIIAKWLKERGHEDLLETAEETTE